MNDATCPSSAVPRLRLGLFGFGRTGKAVAAFLATHPDVVLCWIVRRCSGLDGSERFVLGVDADQPLPDFVAADQIDDAFFRNHPVDVLIDFSSSAGVRTYAAAAEQGIRIVSAVSKYAEDDLAMLRALATRTAVLHSPNITVGINALFVLSQALQRVLPPADIEIVEEHFRDKQETSGTAVRLAELLSLNQQKHVNSVRVGGIIGHHEVIFGRPYQVIRLSHDTIFRTAFGDGALFAARQIMKQQTGFHTMEETFGGLMRDALADLYQPSPTPEQQQ